MAATGDGSEAPTVTDDAAQPRGSLLKQAKTGNERAIATLFKQFVPENERVVAVDYLGVQGLWGLGTSSFACVTSRRIAGIRVKIFGEVTYQDAALEHVNSGAVHQPSKFKLYLYVIIWVGLTFGIGLLFLPLIVRLFYRFNKSGVVLSVREGIPVYLFSDRKRLVNVNRLYRAALEMREGRISEIGTSATAVAAAPTV